MLTRAILKNLSAKISDILQAVYKSGFNALTVFVPTERSEKQYIHLFARADFTSQEKETWEWEEKRCALQKDIEKILNIKDTDIILIYGGVNKEASRLTDKKDAILIDERNASDIEQLLNQQLLFLAKEEKRRMELKAFLEVYEREHSNKNSNLSDDVPPVQTDSLLLKQAKVEIHTALTQAFTRIAELMKQYGIFNTDAANSLVEEEVYETAKQNGFLQRANLTSCNEPHL